MADLRAPTPSAAAELVVPSQIELAEKFNNVYRRMYQQAMRAIENRRLRVNACSDRPVFKNPIQKIENAQQRLDNLSYMLETAYKNGAAEKKRQLAECAAKLEGLSPLGTLARGYSVAKGKDGKVIKSVSQVCGGDMISVRVSDGEITAQVSD